ncbi:YdcF family protein [Paenibacillus senegalensis]|uniref:YdcF family protein n=1 Tax=Paenibacillus senegalensis TaxID=1465766 RepID=UPI000287EBFE|nr:YdcF family protein [Paenibacillus senegalensis]
MRSKKIKRFILASSILLLAAVIWTGYVQWKIAAAVRTASKQPADTAIVLGAALWDGRPSPALRERLEAAVELFDEGAVDSIIVSGGLGSGSEITEAEGMFHYLTSRGIPEQAIYLEEQATDTWENLYYSHEIMEANEWSSAIVVTHDFHGARALEMAAVLPMEETQLWLVESSVLNGKWHRGRETLAYAKWVWQKWTMRLGGSGG